MAIRVAWFIAALTFLPLTASAQTPDNILLVVNDDSAASKQIADHYIQVRKVPDRNVVRLHTVETDAISRADYVRTIEEPIAGWLTRKRLQDQVLYIVLTKGIPLRIEGSQGMSGTLASVDSELTLLYRELVLSPVSIVSRLDNPTRADAEAGEGTRFARQADLYFVTALTRDDPQLSLLQRPVIGEQVPIIGRVDNPYFLGDKNVKEAARLSRVNSDLYLVTRLDGFTVDDVIKLIDRGAAPAKTGEIVLDQKATAVDRGGDMWLDEAATRLKAMTPAPVVQLESTRAVAASSGPVLGYFSWGSNDPADIEALFTEDARYFTAPYRTPWSGREEVVEGWLERAYEPGTWSFQYEVRAVQGDLAFVQGWTQERDDVDAWNLWVIRFDEQGRASEFVEWWMDVE